MPTRFDTRQSINHTILARLSGLADTELDDLLASINTEVTPPLALSAVGTNRVVNIANILATNASTGITRTIPPISNTLPVFASGTVTFTSPGPSVTATPSAGSPVNFTVANGNYIKIGINIDASGSLVVQAGTEGASAAAATVPPLVPNTFGIGYVIIHSTGGTIDNILNSTIVQYVGGGGGSGSGDANSFLETIKADLRESSWQLATPNIFSVNADDLIDGTSTGAYSLVTQNYQFSAGAEFMLSTQMLDANEFLNAGRDVDSIQLLTQWDLAYIDTAATYEVSRNGGNEFQSVTMERIGTTDTCVGTLVFATEAADQSLVTQAATTTTATLNATTTQRYAQLFTLANSSVARKVDLYVTKGGTPIGNIYVSFVNNNAGLPSTALADLLAESSAIPISGLTNGINTITIPDTVLPAGSYHIVIRTDSGYQTDFTNSAGVNNLQLQIDGTADGLAQYDGTSWSDPGTTGMKYTLKGRVLDLRVKITSSAGSKRLNGYGILYDLQTSGIVGGIKNRQVFRFNSTTNPNSFALTNFSPDPDLLNVYMVETGQVFKAPSFYLSGNTVVFPANSFNNGGTPADFTLVFDQTTGSSFDNSDNNGLLLASNFLGSNDASIDRSVNGRGIFLRRPDGTLREIALDDQDNLVVYSTP